MRFWQAAVMANIPRDVLPHVLGLLAGDGRMRGDLLVALEMRLHEAGVNQAT